MGKFVIDQEAKDLMEPEEHNYGFDSYVLDKNNGSRKEGDIIEQLRRRVRAEEQSLEKIKTMHTFSQYGVYPAPVIHDKAVLENKENEPLERAKRVVHQSLEPSVRERTVAQLESEVSQTRRYLQRITERSAKETLHSRYSFLMFIHADTFNPTCTKRLKIGFRSDRGSRHLFRRTSCFWSD